MSDKNFNGYPEEDKKKKKELIIGKVIDEIRKSVRGKIKEKVTIIKRNDKDGGEYREYTPLSNSNWDHPSKNKTELGEATKYKPNQKISKQEWGKIAKFNKHIGKDGKHYVTQLTSKGTTLVPVVVEAKARDYKAEYKKYGSSTKAKKYRAELNKYNRQKGTYGNGDKKDASHKGGKIVGFEAESKNRGRAEKSRLKKEEKLDEFNKAHFLNLIKQEIESIKGQIAYAKDKVNYKGTEDWVKKEFKAVLKDKIKDLKDIVAHYNRVKKLKEGKWAGTETGQAAPPKSSAEKQAVKLYGAYIEYKMNSGGKQYGFADQRNKLALIMLKDKFKVPSNLKSKLKDKKYHDKYTDYKSIVWEGKLTESQVAKTILQQLGGNKFIAMTGAKNLGASGKSLSMKIGRNSKSISHVVITLKSSDLYDMEFIRMRGASRKVVKKVTGVYNDMLGKIFTKYTGLRVRL